MARELIFKSFVNGQDVIGARPLERRHVQGCRVVESREALLDELPKGGIVAELGVQTGRFANEIMSRMKPREYHGFDMYLRQVRYDLFPTLTQPLARFYEGDSSSLLGQFPDGSFDMIYIDGDHSYRGARADAQVAIRKMKPDGFVVFNDYTPWSILENFEYGVMRVVNELCDEEGFVMAFLGLQVLGYHDVALRRATPAS